MASIDRSGLWLAFFLGGVADLSVEERNALYDKTTKVAGVPLSC